MEERTPYTVKTMFPPILPSEPKNTANYVLKTEPISSIIPAWQIADWENELRSLMTRANFLKQQLGLPK